MCSAAPMDENNKKEKKRSKDNKDSNFDSNGEVVSANGGKTSTFTIGAAVAAMIVAAISSASAATSDSWRSPFSKPFHWNEDAPPHEQYIRTGFYVLLLGHLAIGTAYSSNTILTYPSPAIWRFQRSLSTFYLLVLLILLSLPRDEGRELLRTIFPAVGLQSSFSMRISASASSSGSTMGTGTCSFSLQALYLQIFHAPWFLSHALGWMGKMLVIRDLKTCFLAAVLFEVVEVTLVGIVPEFEECWWDSVFLDALGANLIGMGVGELLNRFVDGRRRRRDGDEGGGVHFDLGSPFDWAKSRTITSPSSSAPIVGRNIPRFAIVTFVLLFAQLLDILTFLLINAYGVVDNKSWAIQGRLHAVGWLCVPAAAEFYSSLEGVGVDDDCRGDINSGHDNGSGERANSKNSRKEGSTQRKMTLGPCTILLLVIAACELWLSCVLYFPDHMRREMQREGNVAGLPRHTWVAHAISLTFLAVWTAVRYCGPLSRPPFVGGGVSKEEERARRRRRAVTVAMTNGLLLGAAFVPQFFLFWKGWKWD